MGLSSRQEEELTSNLPRQARSPDLPTILPEPLRAGLARAAAVSHVPVTKLDDANWNSASREKDECGDY